MTTTSASQLFLLADHIKLSLLERQRAISLNLDPNTNDPQISRSLDHLASGIQALEAQSSQWDDPLHPSSEQQECADSLNSTYYCPSIVSSLTSPFISLASAIATLKQQQHELSSTFHSSGASTATTDTLTSPNDPSLAPDFSRAQQTKPPKSKSVRFTDSREPEAAARQTLFPARYTDDPSLSEDSTPPDQSALTNTEIHTYHQQVLRQQDDQLDQLGHSINRQRDLSIQIGDELDDQAVLLDEVDERVDRHQSSLDRAKGRLGRVVKGAREHWSLTAIAVLIVILVLLIVITKR